jgi:flagellar biosynthetic protein FliQ
MGTDALIDLVRQALFIALEISAPLLLIAMVVGFGISVFQSVTQINEMTLTFVPKIFIFTMTLMAFFPWMLKIMVKFTEDLMVFQWDKVVSLVSLTN